MHFKHAAAGFDRSRFTVFGRFELLIVAVIGVYGGSYASSLRMAHARTVSPSTAHRAYARFSSFFPYIPALKGPFNHMLRFILDGLGTVATFTERKFV